ncbi:hypothetical protein MNB_SV-9-1643 [hydrothermal vent metagenome]|uniref:HlyD family secretion protein n=1 Tax=hydrothermal vent metagenome TaxID=652676 RepID=A0A1W1C1H7_9ZZZZ
MFKILLLIISSVSIFADIHYAKVEPYQTITIKSAVSAKVLSVDLESEGEMIGDGEIIHLDDVIDKIDLKNSKDSLGILKSSLEINRDILSSLKKSLKRQKAYYQRINRLTTASTNQKDNAFNSFVSYENQYLSTKDKIGNIKKQILDMEFKINRLKDTIGKKSIKITNQYLYKISVRAGDFVNPSSPLAVVQDQSRGKLTLFLEPNEIKNIYDKKIYIDGEVTDYRIDKIWNSADDKYISLYRAEIYIKSPKNRFSKLMKVELK